MPIHWLQLAYGKLVGPDGVVRTDYTPTGLSAQFPPALRPRCEPTELGVSNFESWSAYPWRETGGALILRPLRDPGTARWYLAAGRVCPRADDPTTKNKRYYAETRHAVTLLPSSGIDYSALFSLPSALRADALQEQTSALEPIDTFGEDVRLPTNWFPRVRPLLEAIASGHRVTVIGSSVAPESFFAMALMCLACLPGTLRWRMPIGCGLYDVPGEEQDTTKFALVHGARGAGRVRWEDGTVRGPVDCSAGRVYADWIEGFHRRVNTINGLVRAVDERLKPLDAPFALDGNIPWSEAVRAIDEVRLLRELHAWLSSAGSTVKPDIEAFNYFRPTAAGAILTSAPRRHERPGLEPPAARLLDKIATPEWADAWEAAAVAVPDRAETIRAAAGLLGVRDTLNPAALGGSPPFDLPKDLFAKATERLTPALTKARGADLLPWASLINLAGNARARPAWLGEWAEKVPALLAWRTIGLFLHNAHTTTHVADWIEPRQHALRAAHAIVTDREVHKDDFRALCDQIPDGVSPDGAALAEYLRKEYPAEAIFLAERAETVDTPTWLTDKLTAESLLKMSEDTRDWWALALAGVARRYGHPARVLWGLAALWDFVPPPLRDGIVKPVVEFLGQPLAKLLVDADWDPLTPAGNGAWGSARIAVALSNNRLSKVIGQIVADPRSSRELMTQLIEPALTQIDPQLLETRGPVLPFVARLFGKGERPDYPADLKPADLDLARELAEAIDPPKTRPNPPTSLKQLDAMFAFTRWFKEPPDMGMPLWSELFTKSVSDIPFRNRWVENLKRTTWAKLPLWRLPDGIEKLEELTDEEEALVAMLDDPAYLWYVLRGAPVSPRLMTKLNAVAMTRLLDPVVSSYDAEKLMTRLNSSFVRYEVFRFAWSKLNDPNHRTIVLAWARPKWGKTYDIRPPRADEYKYSWAWIAYTAFTKMEPASQDKLFQLLEKTPDKLPSVLSWRRVTDSD